MNGMLLTDDECRECYGVGSTLYVLGSSGVEERRTCLRCRGIGTQLTALGEELMKMLSEIYELEPKAKR